MRNLLPNTRLILMMALVVLLGTSCSRETAATKYTMETEQTPLTAPQPAATAQVTVEPAQEKAPETVAPSGSESVDAAFAPEQEEKAHVAKVQKQSIKAAYKIRISGFTQKVAGKAVKKKAETASPFLEGGLRTGIILVAIGLILAILGGLIPTVGVLFYVVGIIILVIGLILILLYLLDSI